MRIIGQKHIETVFTNIRARLKGVKSLENSFSMSSHPEAYDFHKPVSNHTRLFNSINGLYAKTLRQRSLLERCFHIETYTTITDLPNGGRLEQNVSVTPHTSRLGKNRVQGIGELASEIWVVTKGIFNHKSTYDRQLEFLAQCTGVQDETRHFRFSESSLNPLNWFPGLFRGNNSYSLENFLEESRRLQELKNANQH